MKLAEITISKIIVMFIIMLVGMICYRVRLIDERTNEKLSNVLLLLISPLLIFTSYQREFNPDMLYGLLSAIFLAAVSHLIAIVVAGILIKKNGAIDWEIERMSAIYSNCGFMGIPLVNEVFGAEGVFFMTAYVTVFNLLIWTHGVILMTGQTDMRSCIKALKTPSIFAIVIGLACYLCHITLPAVLLEPLQSIANMNTPLAMLVAGVSVASSDIKTMLKKKRSYYMCGIRLVLIPLLTLFVLKLFQMDKMVTTTIIMAAACPAGATGTLFALRYKKNAIYAAELFGMSTVFSLVTIPFVMLICGNVI